jgi:hypothetical protein
LTIVSHSYLVIEIFSCKFTTSSNETTPFLFLSKKSNIILSLTGLEYTSFLKVAARNSLNVIFPFLEVLMISKYSPMSYKVVSRFILLYSKSLLSSVKLRWPS